jgi:hypothetical protein
MVRYLLADQDTQESVGKVVVYCVRLGNRYYGNCDGQQVDLM